MATVCEPPIAVLDEPTTGLDVLTQDRVLAELRASARRRSRWRWSTCRMTSPWSPGWPTGSWSCTPAAARARPAPRLSSSARDTPTRVRWSPAIPDVRRPRALRGIAGVSVGVGEWPAGLPVRAPLRVRRGALRRGLAVAGERWRVGSPRALLPLARAQPATRSRAGLSRAALRATATARRCSTCRGSWPATAPGPRTPRRSQTSPSRSSPGECVALVGESGSGKSTIARCIAGLHVPSAGTIAFDGEPVAGAARSRPLEVRRRIQIVFQNPYASLNPQHSACANRSSGPLRASAAAVSSRGRARGAASCSSVSACPPRLADRFPAELSGGERQRVAIARALAANPTC